MPVPTSDPYGTDIYTEAEADEDTLSHLGPLRPLAGRWRGTGGDDDHPVVEGTEHDTYVEDYDLQPIDPQTNGPQLFYGLRYHTHIVKPGEVETFHDQVGYWLWEPDARLVTQMIAIPRSQVALAVGPAEPDATEFTVSAEIGSAVNGIISNPFLERAFRTVSFRIHVVVNADGTWSYDQETVLEIPGRSDPFRHVDRNTLSRVEAPTPNPLAAGEGSPSTRRNVRCWRDSSDRSRRRWLPGGITIATGLPSRRHSSRTSLPKSSAVRETTNSRSGGSDFEPPVGPKTTRTRSGPTRVTASTRTAGASARPPRSAPMPKPRLGTRARRRRSTIRLM